MRKLFSILAAVLFAGSMMAADVTVSKSVHDLFPDDANGTQEAILYSDANLKISVNDDGNNGKIYGTGTEWRLYHTNNAVITVTATNATIKTVAFEFTVNKNGVLLFGESEMESGTAVNINAASAQFTVDGGETGKTNGQVIVKGFTVVYTPGDGGGSGEGGGEGGGTGEATELTFEAAGATYDDGGAGFATWTLDLFNNETDYPEVIVTVYAKEVDKIAGTYQTSEIKEIALQLSATESGYYFANSPSASTISNISDLQINYMNNGVYKYTMSSFEFNGQTYKFDADLATTGNLHDGSDQGGSGEGGETGEDITMSITIGSVHYDDEGSYGTWTFNLSNGNDAHFLPGVLITVKAIANDKIASTYGADDIFSVIANLDGDHIGEMIDNYEDLKVSYLSNNTYKFEFKFTAESGQKYIINASLVIDDSSLRDGTDQGGSGEGGEGGETPEINETHTLEVSFCEARLVEENTLHGNQSTWEFILYNEMEGESAFAAPNARVLVYAKSKTSIAGTYAANTAIIEMSGTPMAGSPAYATTWSDVKISYRGENRYSFKFDFVGSVGSLFDEFIVNRIVEVSAKNADNSEAIQLDESATAISNTETVVKAVKTIKDGQLIIERNGVNYNANGQIVR